MTTKKKRPCIFAIGFHVVTACSDDKPGPGAPVVSYWAGAETSKVEEVPVNPLRDAYFGDLHVHTIHSPDAYLYGVRVTADDDG